MSEHLLDDTHVRPSRQQMRGEGVAQGVGGDAPLISAVRPDEPGPFGGLLEDRPGALPAQGPAQGVEEDLRHSPALLSQDRSAPHQVGVQRLPGVGPHGDHALLASLAEQPQQPGVGVEVVDDEPHRLGDAGAGGVENLQQRSVAQAHRGVVDAGGLQEDADLIDP